MLTCDHMGTRMQLWNLPENSAWMIQVGTRWSGAGWTRTPGRSGAEARSLVSAMRTPPLLGIALQESQPSFSILGSHSTEKERWGEEMISNSPTFTFTLASRTWHFQWKCDANVEKPCETTTELELNLVLYGSWPRIIEKLLDKSIIPNQLLSLNGACLCCPDWLVPTEICFVTVQTWEHSNLTAITTIYTHDVKKFFVFKWFFLAYGETVAGQMSLWCAADTDLIINGETLHASYFHRWRAEHVRFQGLRHTPLCLLAIYSITPLWYHVCTHTHRSPHHIPCYT